MTDVQEILDAVVEELHRAFGYYCCAAVRVRADGHVESAAGRGDALPRARPRASGPSPARSA